MAITTTDQGYIFVPRKDWGARHSAGTKKMASGRNKVFIHHTVTVPSGDPCRDMRTVEDVLHQRGLAPGYSYVVHPSGVVLEGAGQMVGAHTGGHNSEGFGISFIGNYDRDTPTLASLIAVARTINLLRLGGNLTPNLADIDIIPHRSTKQTACPGANMVQPVLMGSTALNWIRLLASRGA